MTALSFPDGHIITGAEWQQLLEFLLPLYVRKSTQENSASSTTAQDDDDLYLPLEANAVYFFQALILCNGPTAADLKLQWTYPAGASIDWLVGGTDDAMVTQAYREDWTYGSAASSFGIGVAGAGTGLAYQPAGLVRTSSTADLLRVSWAQWVSNATPTIIQSGSYLVAYRIQ